MSSENRMFFSSLPFHIIMKTSISLKTIEIPHPSRTTRNRIIPGVQHPDARRKILNTVIPTFTSDPKKTHHSITYFLEIAEH